MPLVRTLTGGLLPESLAAEYGLPRRPARFRMAIAVVRVIARLTPRRVSELPSRRLLRRIPAY
jgi:uncharacterized protein (DUF2236 family)